MNVHPMGGIFVGGQARRMGGVPKGLLVTPSGETIVARLARILETLGLTPVLVGAHPAYAACSVARIEDDAAARGPLGGLIALLEYARGRPVIAVACDMPYVSERLVAQLMAMPPAPVVAARRDGRWEPFFARYDSARVLQIARDRASAGAMALQGLLDTCGAEELPLDSQAYEELRDWDTPEDMARS